MVVSGKYVRYRSLFHCILSDVYGDVSKFVRKLINRLKGKKEEKPPKKKNDGYRRWARTEWGGGEV